MEIRNLVIIGSGPAAWTAAIYAARAKLNPLVLAGEQNGGQLMNTTLVENFPGFPEGVMGPELMSQMREQAEKLGVEIVDANTISLSVIGSRFSVLSSKSIGYRFIGQNNRKLTDRNLRTDNGKLITAKTVIIAVGAVANTLKLPGEEKLMGRGVGVCAVCDAPFYKDAERVFVIGGGDSAIEEALALAKYAKEVVILVRKDKMRAAPIAIDHIKKNKNVKIWYRSEAKELIGEKKLEKIKIVKEGKEEIISTDGLFYAIGHTPATGWLKGSGIEIDGRGYIKTHISNIFSEHSENSDSQKTGRSDSLSVRQSGSPSIQSFLDYPTSTSVGGIFAAGDCADWRYKQAITAAGMGCMAALDAQAYLESRY